MLSIDGSTGEGGGQILRPSLAVSELTRSVLRNASVCFIVDFLQ